MKFSLKVAWKQSWYAQRIDVVNLGGCNQKKTVSQRVGGVEGWKLSRCMKMMNISLQRRWWKWRIRGWSVYRPELWWKARCEADGRRRNQCDFLAKGLKEGRRGGRSNPWQRWGGYSASLQSGYSYKVNPAARQLLTVYFFNLSVPSQCIPGEIIGIIDGTGKHWALTPIYMHTWGSTAISQWAFSSLPERTIPTVGIQVQELQCKCDTPRCCNR